MTTNRHNDQPTTDDALGFAPAAAVLATLIADTPHDDTPLTLGIYGEWGSGKTSMLKMIERKLTDRPGQTTTVIPVWFESWRYAQQDRALWRALLVRIIASLRAKLLPSETLLRGLHAGETEAQASAALTQQLDDAQTRLYRSFTRDKPGELAIDWAAASRLVASLALKSGAIPAGGTIEAALTPEQTTLWDVLHRERAKVYGQQVEALDEFEGLLRELIDGWIVKRNRLLVVFIDDLDRCLPEQAVGVLEAIKVFLDIPGCIFVLGMDRAIIERGIAVRYRDLVGAAGGAPVRERDYLEKIVQIPYTLAPLSPALVKTFLTARLAGTLNLTPDMQQQVAATMVAGLARNPRKVKRTLNTFRLLYDLAQANGRTEHPALLAKLVVLQSSYAAIYERVAASPALLTQLEAEARGQSHTGGQEVKDEIAAHPALKAMLAREPNFAKLGEETVRDIVYQSATTRPAAAG